MAQVDLEAVRNSLTTLAAQIPLFANHPGVDVVGGLRQLLEAMEQRLTHRTEQINERITETNGRITETNERIAEMHTDIIRRLNYNEKLGFARAQNSSAHKAVVPLSPVPLPGTVDFPDNFPETLGDFRGMPGTQLSNFINQYDLVPPGGIPPLVENRRSILSKHFGISL